MNSENVILKNEILNLKFRKTDSEKCHENILAITQASH